jgi:hypothetical protein
MKKRYILAVLLVVGIVGFLVAQGKRPNITAPSDATTLGVSPTPLVSRDRGLELTQPDSEPLTFSTLGLSVTVTQTPGKTSADAAYLLSNAATCGPMYRPHSYYPDLTATLKKLPKTVYKITETGKAGAYTISLIPNLLGYKDLDGVQADFFSCPGDAGHLKAIARNDTWLVFTSVCAETDTVCHELGQKISPTIKLK